MNHPVEHSRHLTMDVLGVPASLAVRFGLRVLQRPHERGNLRLGSTQQVDTPGPHLAHVTIPASRDRELLKIRGKLTVSMG
jgi:hypothetical protein